MSAEVDGSGSAAFVKELQPLLVKLVNAYAPDIDSEGWSEQLFAELSYERAPRSSISRSWRHGRIYVALRQQRTGQRMVRKTKLYLST